MTGRPAPSAAIRLLLALGLLAVGTGSGWARSGDDDEASGFIPSPYYILRTHLPDSPGGPQMAVSLGRYIVNLGSRVGVRRGSMFEVRKDRALAGIVRAEQIWRDSSSVRLVQLEQKLDPDKQMPLGRGYRLYPKYVLLETINFGTGKPDFTTDMHERLRYATRFILSFPDYPVSLEGHTDNTGDRKANVKLSLQRARAIREYLNDVQLIPLSQMQVAGYADDRPIGSNDTADGRFLNRRVDIVMLDMTERTGSP